MKCPECDRKTHVTETRGTLRRRLCTQGHRFWTQELLVVAPSGRAQTAERARQGAELVAAGWSVARAAKRMEVAESTLRRRLPRPAIEPVAPAADPLSNLDATLKTWADAQRAKWRPGSVSAGKDPEL